MKRLTLTTALFAEKAIQNILFLALSNNLGHILMTKIVTLTFSPCIDKSTSVISIIPEKKIACQTPKYEPGGGGVNVARAIVKLGGEATAIFPSGGYSGKFFNQLLAKENVASIVIEASHDTRENLSVFDESTNNQYRFGMPAPVLLEHEIDACLKALEGHKKAEFIVVSGSLPAGIPLNVYARLAGIASKNNAKLIVDASGPALIQAMKEGVYLLKPNLNELSDLIGKKELQTQEAEQAAKEIIAKGKCDILVVSLGPQGALLVTKDLTKTITPPSINRKSTVGAGDSMVAGISFYLSLGKSVFEAVQYGVACGTAATMNAGTELCRKEDADELLKLLKIK